MKKFKKTQFMQKIIISIMLAISFQFLIPNYSKAGWSLAGNLIENICQFFAAVGDVVTGAFNAFMIYGENTSLTDMGTSMIELDDANYYWMREDLDEEAFAQAFSTEISNLGQGQVQVVSNNDYTGVLVQVDYLEEGLFWRNKWQIPNMMYSPENIFANNIKLFDINFINPNTYNRQESIAGLLQNTVASWYRTFRNVAAVGLLSVLLYIGIRIVIGSVGEKAKYKEMLRDWLFAMCLLFIMQFIMAAILMITEKFNDIFAEDINKGIMVYIKGSDLAWQSQFDNEGDAHYMFKSNYMGVIRFLIQTSDENWENIVAYTIIYFALIIYTGMFTFQYFKRVLYMAFYTMISPLVALSYPIDKAGDSKAQAFNTWFREFIMTALTQPIHLLLYSMLVSSSMELTLKNPIYGLVAIGFLIPAEKFVRSLFNVQPQADQGMGSFAGGALAMGLLNTMKKPPLPNLMDKGKGESGGSSSDSSESTQPKTDLSAYNNGGPSQGGVTSRDSTGELGGGDQEGDGINLNTGNSRGINRDGMPQDEGQESIEEQIAREREQRESMGIELPDSYYQNRREQLAQEGQQENYNNQQNVSGQQRTSTISSQNNNNQNGFKRKLKRATPYLKRGAKFAAKKGVRGLVRAGTIGGGILIGAAAGLTTGKMENVFQNAAAGAFAGNVIGKNLNDTAVGLGRKAVELKNNASIAATEINSGYLAADEKKKAKKKEKDRKTFLNDKAQYERYKKIAAKIEKKTGQQYDIDKLMNAAADYRENDITDNNTIEKGLMMEAKNGGVGGENHEKTMGIATLAQKYDSSYIFDEKKNNTLKNEVYNQVGEDLGRDVMNDFKEFHLNADKNITQETQTREQSRTQPRTRPGTQSRTRPNTQP